MTPSEAKAHCIDPRRIALDEQIQQLIQRPHFKTLVGEYCVSMLDSHLFKSIGRALTQEFRIETCLRIIINYGNWSKDNAKALPTLALVKSQSRASDRHIATLVTFLQHVGLVILRRHPSDARVKLIAPTAKLFEEVGRHIRLVYQMYVRLLTEDITELSIVDDQKVMELLVYGNRVGTDGAGIAEKPYHARVAFFAAHDGGWLVMCAIFLSHYVKSLRLDMEPIKLTYDVLSSKIGLSKSHVANLMRHATGEKWIDVARGGELLNIDPEFVREFEDFIAEQAAHFGAMDTQERALVAG